MPVVLLNHGNTGAELFSEPIHRHPVAGQHHGGAVTLQAVRGARLAVARTEYRLVKSSESYVIR